MGKQKLIAYNSRVMPFIFLLCLIPVIFVGVIIGINANEIYHWIFFGIDIIVTSVLIIVFFYHLSLPDVAFEIIEERMILYKKKSIIEINLKEINSIRICEDSSSFDCSIWVNNQKIEVHYFIKRKKEICIVLEQILTVYGIKVNFYNIDIGD